MPRYTFRFETDPSPHIDVTVPADNAEQARAKAEIVALSLGRIQTLGRLLDSWEEPPSTDRPGDR